MAREFIKLTLPNDISYLPIAQLCVEEAARKYGFPEGDLVKIGLALEEAVANVVEHAFGKDEEMSFDLLCERIPLGITISIIEKGLPFDPEQLPEYHPSDTMEQMSTAGLGIFLLRESMDEISYHNLGLDGKETRLVKYLPGSDIRKLLTPSEPANKNDPEKAVPVIAEKIPYSVRLIEPHEAIEVSRGAYRSHGYTFFDDIIYYPGKIVELNRTGEMISAVAVTEDNTFMGHAAFLYPKPGLGIAELTFVFVNPEYRGQGCFNRLCDYLFSVPKQTPLSGVYAYAVANHPFTQKTMMRYGINDSGIELATSPTTWSFKGIKGDSSQRISVVLGFKYVTPPDSLTLYPPPRHRVMVEKLYKNLRADHSFAAPDDPSYSPNPAGSVIDTVLHASEGSAEIFVKTYGAHVVREVKSILRDLCIKQVSSITLFLNLEDPDTYFISEEFETMGFFFSGILPHSGVGDALILQYLNNVEFNYSKVIAYSDTAKEILAYIKANDPNIM